jgi:pyridoxamine 5'-phosphate oxidase
MYSLVRRFNDCFVAILSGNFFHRNIRPSRILMKVEQSLANLRINYTEGVLMEKDCPSDPMVLFKSWIDKAQEFETEPNAMCLSTADKQTGRPSSRIVLLKHYDSDGFVFFTNYESRKGQELESNPFCSLVFWWGQRSIRVEGIAKRIPEQESVAYFKSRPIGSQWGAWSSHQSKPIANRTVLEQQEIDVKQKYGEDCPKPPFWGGYRVVADAIEFWQGRPSRLHDRIKYVHEDGGWKFVRLSP